MRVPGETDWQTLERDEREDPFYARQQKLDGETPMKGTRRLNEPRKSTHIWVGNLPEGLSQGTHLIEVRAEDAYGHEFKDHRPVQVR
jgi:hypothetical protein